MSQTVRVIAPAKVNLFLSIGSVQADGYHAATSILHAITLHDTLTMCFTQAEGEGLEVAVSCQGVAGIEPPDVASSDNIAYKAVVALAQALGRKTDERVTVQITKAIPHAAGLGGGSSDAAAALVGAAQAWGIDPLSDQVLEVARGLGADVPFFLYGGCARMTGRGDVLERALEPMKRPLVVVRPDVGVSTAAAYREFDRRAAGAAEDLAPSVEAAAEAERAASTAKAASELFLFNNLALASEVLVPELARVRTWLAMQTGVAKNTMGVPQVLLSGSGSASFAVCESMDAAIAIVAAAKLEGWWARSCSFTSIGARVLDTSADLRR